MKRRFASRLGLNHALTFVTAAAAPLFFGCAPVWAAPTPLPNKVIPLPAPDAASVSAASAASAPQFPIRAGWVASGDQFVPASLLRSHGEQSGGRLGDAAPFSVGGQISKWPGGRVTYVYDASMTPGRIRAFESACREWEKYADLHFAPRAGEANYLRVIGNNTNGSYLGMTGGEQPLFLSDSANTFTGCHELGHALGVIHEHQRPDRDQYIVTHPENVEVAFRSFFGIFDGALNQGAYDFDSIMHYGDRAFSVNGEKTITAQPQYAEFERLMGQGDHLSEGDKRGMALIYGASKITAATISNVTVAEAPGGSTALLKVTLTQPAAQRITLNWQTLDGSALAGSDYVAGQGTLAFNAGETSKTIAVSVLDDGFIEPDETFVVRLSNPGAVTLSEFDRDGLVTIKDNDTLKLESPPSFAYYLDNVGFGPCVASTNVSGVTSMQFLARPMITGQTGKFAIPDDGTSHVQTVPIRSAQKGTAVYLKFDVSHPASQELEVKVRTPEGSEFTLGLPYETTIYDLTDFLKGRELIGDWTISARDTVPNENVGTMNNVQIIVAPASSSETLLATDSDGVNANNKWVGEFNPRSLSNGNYIFIARALQGTTVLGEAANQAVLIDQSGGPLTDLSISANGVPQNQQVGTPVGTLTTSGEAVGPNAPPVTYTLVAGEGDSDNAAFNVRGDVLVTARRFDDSQRFFSVRIKADNGASSISKPFSLALISETPPPKLSVTLSSLLPKTRDVLTATPTVTAADGGADNSAYTYNFQWLKNRVAIPGATTATLDLGTPGHGDKNDVIACEVTATSAGGGTAKAGVQVVVQNSQPVAISSKGEVPADTLKGFVLNFYDADGDAVTYKRVGGPRNGVTADIRVDPADGKTKLFYKSRPFYGGVDIIRFVVFDSSNKQSNESTLGINVLYTPPPPANRAPIAGDTNIDTYVGKSEVKGLLGSDPDGDAITFRIVGNAKYGSSEIKRDTDGAFKLFYTSLNRFYGNDSVTYVIKDSRGKESNLATVNINFINRSPVALGNRIQVASGETVSQFLFADDPDNDAVTYRLVNNPRYGRGEVKLDSEGKWRFFYTSLPGYVGPDQITFIAIDSFGKESSVAAIDINVVRVSSTPAGALRSGGEAPSGGGS